MSSGSREARAEIRVGAGAQGVPECVTEERCEERGAGAWREGDWGLGWGGGRGGLLGHFVRGEREGEEKGGWKLEGGRWKVEGRVRKCFGVGRFGTGWWVVVVGVGVYY